MVVVEEHMICTYASNVVFRSSMGNWQLHVIHHFVQCVFVWCNITDRNL